MSEPSKEPRRWLRLGHLELSDLLVETFSVLLGVLLALLINAWVQKRQTHDKVDEAMTSIRQELQANRQTLNTLSTYEGRLIEGIDKALKTPHPPAYCDEVDEWHGIYSPLESQLLHAAYDTATASGVFADMDFESLRRVAGLYARLNRYEDYYSKSVEWMMQRRLSSHAEGFEIGMCRGIVHDLAVGANRLQQDLDSYLNQK